jgi:hypothetical protein
MTENKNTDGYIIQLECACGATHEITLFSTAQIAATLHKSPRNVRALAHSHNLGIHLGHDLLFTQQDVDFMKGRKPGNPNWTKAPLPATA